MPSRPYGPNTDAVRRLLQRLAALPADEWVRLARLYEGLHRTPRFAAADRALGEAMAAAGREAERDAALGPVVQLAADAAARVARAAGGVPSDDDAAVDDSAADRFAEPALAAVLAVIARDVLDEEQFTTLYGAVSWAVPLAELGRYPAGR